MRVQFEEVEGDTSDGVFDVEALHMLPDTSREEHFVLGYVTCFSDEKPLDLWQYREDESTKSRDYRQSSTHKTNFYG